MKTTPHLNGRLIGLVSASLLCAAMAASSAFAQAQPAAAAPAPLMPQALIPGALVVPLWPAGSPMLNADYVDQPEVAAPTDKVPGRVQGITNVNNPSIEVHLADIRYNNGAAIILAPGGGDTSLVVGTEGTDMIPFFNNLNMNVFILRYRLRPYTGQDANNDTAQAVRMVRAHAQEWGVDPKKIGIAGFSAGGERVGYITVSFDAGDPNATDPVAKVSSRPDFVAGIYPSGSTTGAPRNAPPGFFVVSMEDTGHASGTMTMALNLMNAGVHFVELHMYPYGQHGDGMKDRDGSQLGTWQDRFTDWIRDLGFLNKAGVPTKVDEFSQQAPIAAPARGGRGAGGGRRGGGGAPAAVAPAAPDAAPAAPVAGPAAQ